MIYDFLSAAPYNYNCTKVYNGTAQDVIDVINNGCFIVNFRDHGDSRNGPGGYYEGWGTPPFRTHHIDNNLSNGEMLAVMFSMCCRTGWFDGETDLDDTDPTPIPDCLGESWLKANNKGGVGFIGSTRVSYTGYNDAMNRGFYDTIWPDFDSTYISAEISSPTYNIGAILDYGKLYMYDKYIKTGGEGYEPYSPIDTAYNRVEFEEFLILGDPALELWTATPSQFTNVSIYDDGDIVYVSLGESGCDICVSSGKNGEYYHSVVYNVSGTGFETPVRPLYITVTKHNYIPYTAVTGGTFTSDETWFGNLHVLSSCSFTSDATLTILPGTNILMDGYHNLSFLDNARLIAEGTEEAPIVFTSASGTSPSSWRRLYIRTGDNILSHCEIKYGEWALFMVGYPSSGNVVEYCNIHDNDQGIRIDKNNVDVIGCDIFNNRHNVVTTSNAEVNFEGCHIYNGGRDGFYCYSSDLLNLYGCVIENNGNGGTSTRNGIYAVYADVINIGKLSVPNWFGYNTIRNNYYHEVYAGYGASQVEVLYNSIHDNSGYEIYNYNNNPNIWGFMCWWGEFPPNMSQFYGNVTISDELEFQPAWEGQTRLGGLSKASNILASNNESPAERIIRLKNIITSNYRSNQADTALTELFCLLRNDYVNNQYQERSNFSSFLAQVYNNAKSDPAGQRALQYLIVWKTLENDYQSAIALSLTGLNILAEPDRMGVFGNLVYLYASNAQFDKAEEYLEEFRKQYAFNVSEIEFLTESIEVMEEMYEEEKRLAKDSTPPHDEDITTIMIDKFVLIPPIPILLTLRLLSAINFQRKPM